MLQFGNGWTTSEYEATKIASGVSEYVSDCKSNNIYRPLKDWQFTSASGAPFFTTGLTLKATCTNVGAFCVFRA
jgi:hypothetical protein